jgi:hypothetical protein
MADAAIQPSAQTSGGFRIEVGNDELTVTTDNFEASKADLGLLLLGLIVLVASLRLIAARDWLPILLISVTFAIAIVFRFFFGRDRNLHCTRETLQVAEVRRGSVIRTTDYERAKVGEVQFGAVAYSKYGATMGLVFMADKRRVKTLYGLRCVEAQKILAELERLGYRVQHDVGMPMMVEMELERRKAGL